MPITSPSYFPPSRANGSIIGITAGRLATGAACFLGGQSAGDNSTAPNCIVIGDNSGKGGLSGVANALNGTIIVGAQSAQALVGASQLAGAITLIGNNSLKLATTADNSVIIGHDILPLTSNAAGDISKSVLIGDGIWSDAVSRGPGSSVIIGYKAQNTTGNVPSPNNVIIGCFASQNTLASGPDNVLIGYSVKGSGATTASQQNVVIGSGAAVNTGGSACNGNVIIGFQATATSVAGGVGSNIGIGLGSSACAGTDLVGGNVVIGTQASVGQSETTGLNVIIGHKAGTTGGVAYLGALGNVLVIETAPVTPSALLYGSFASGNLVVGNSVQGTNRDLPNLTNSLKLLNSTVTSVTAPVGGGYFYVAAGALHWVGSSGTDTQLAVA